MTKVRKLCLFQTVKSRWNMPVPSVSVISILPLRLHCRNQGDLLRALVEEKDESKVAEGIEKAHYNIPAVKYNDENSLACTIQLALYAAIDYYFVEREVPAGKGIADVVLVPRTLYKDKPAAIIELKWNQDADGAIEQIKEKNYPAVLRDYHGELVLAGIKYDKNDKVHTCRIEAMRI